MSFFISILLIIVGFAPLLLVLNKANIINLNFIKVGFNQLFSIIQKRWRISGTIALVFTLILSPSLNLLANNSSLVVEKIKKDVDASVINSTDSSSIISSESSISSTNSSSTESKKESASSVATSSTSSQSSNSVSSTSSNSSLNSNSSSVSDAKKTEIKDKKVVTQEGITAEIPAGTIITAGDGAALLSKEIIVDKKDKAEVEAKNDEKEKKAEVVFELGNPNQHLVFSKPVKVTVPVTTDDKEVVVGVKHNGQTEYSTDSIVNENGGLQSTFEVKDKIVTFFTLGASSFTVTPSAGTITFTAPANGSSVATTLPVILGTGTTNGATMTLRITPSNTVIGTATVALGVWSVTPTTPLPLGSNTICANGSTTNCTTFTITSAASPAGVSSGLKLWLKADDGVLAGNGTAVTNWKDINSTYTATQGTAGNRPTFNDAGTNLVNFNPSVVFNGSKFLTNTTQPLLSESNYQFITAAKDTVGTNTNQPYGSGQIRGIFGQGASGDNPGLDLQKDGGSANGFNFYSNGGEDNGGKATIYNGGGTGNGVANLPTASINQLRNQQPQIFSLGHSTPDVNKVNTWVDGYKQISTRDTNSTNTAATAFRIGDSGGGEWWNGTINEIIAFNGQQTDADMQKINSYLAIKYGVTLGQGNGAVGTNTLNTDYILSDGTTKVWDATANAAYKNNITVIARDTDGNLNQKQSKSVNYDALVTVGRGAITATNQVNSNSFAVDKSAFAFGDNNGALA